MESSILPLQQKERILLIDAIRGIALCGILILNIYFFSSPYQTSFDYRALNETGQANMATWLATNFLVEGSYRALFSMLFGAGAILLLTRLEKNNSGLLPADIYYRRIIWLLIFGLINAYVLLWVGDILYAYAVCGLFIFPLRNSSTKLLIGLAVFFIAVTMFKGWSHTNDRIKMKEKGVAAQKLEDQKQELTDDQKADLEAWTDYQKKRKVENVKKEAEKEIEAMHGSYAEIWSHLKVWNQKIESSKFYNYLFFDVIIFILLGMAFFKMGIFTGERPVWLYWIFFIGGYGLGIGTGLVEGTLWYRSQLDFFAYLEVRPFPIEIYQLHRICVSLGHIGLIVLLWKSGWFMWFLRPFASVGQMAFTNYLMQSVICTLIFYGYGLAYFGAFERYELWYFVLGVWVFQIVFSVIWLHYFRFGPLEWIWRSLTYWKMQSMRRIKKPEFELSPQP